MTGTQNFHIFGEKGRGPQGRTPPAAWFKWQERRRTGWMDEMERLREFKVHVPLHLHLRLHRHRLLSGQSLSATMQEALDRYFDKHLPDDPGQYEHT